MLRRLNPESVEPLGDNYSQVVVSSGTQVHVSGTLPVDESGSPIGEGDMPAQTARVIENLDRSLDEAGATVSDVVRVRILTLDAEEYLEECHPLLLDWYDGDKPTSTMWEVARLAHEAFLVEIEATAVLDE